MRPRNHLPPKKDERRPVTFEYAPRIGERFPIFVPLLPKKANSPPRLTNVAPIEAVKGFAPCPESADWKEISRRTTPMIPITAPAIGAGFVSVDSLATERCVKR